MTKDRENKKKYEAPVIVPLGELAVSIGAGCGVGTGAGGTCIGRKIRQIHLVILVQCSAACNTGITPGAACATGTGPHA